MTYKQDVREYCTLCKWCLERSHYKSGIIVHVVFKVVLNCCSGDLSVLKENVVKR